MPIPHPAAGPSPRVQSLAMHRTIAIIHGEHRSMRKVLEKMKRTADGMPGKPVSHECTNLRLMLRYIRTFPDAVHHPKEDLYLFAKLRLHTDELDTVLDGFERQHAGGEEWLARMEQALARLLT